MSLDVLLASAVATARNDTGDVDYRSCSFLAKGNAGVGISEMKILQPIRGGTGACYDPSPAALTCRCRPPNMATEKFPPL